MQRKKQSATLRQVALHFSVFTPNCIKMRALCQKNHRFHYENGGFSNFSTRNGVSKNGVGVSFGVSCEKC